jgi:transposase
MQFTHLLGVDISKKNIDIALSLQQGNADMISHQFTNNLGGYKKMVIWLREKGITLDKLLVGMENTGIYHQPLVAFLQRKKALVWVENPVAIKWSMGLVRGKTDRMDAQRVCLYLLRNQDKAKAYSSTDESIEKVSRI